MLEQHWLAGAIIISYQGLALLAWVVLSGCVFMLCSWALVSLKWFPCKKRSYFWSFFITFGAGVTCPVYLQSSSHEDLHSLDNDSFLNSLEAITTCEYWPDRAWNSWNSRRVAYHTWNKSYKSHFNDVYNAHGMLIALSTLCKRIIYMRACIENMHIVYAINIYIHVCIVIHANKSTLSA